MISSITKIFVLIFCLSVFSFQAGAMCEAGAKKCDDVIECDMVTGKCENARGAGSAHGEVICSCAAEYGYVSEPVKTGSDSDSPAGRECTDKVGKWNEEKAVGPRLDDCNNGQCMCYRVYEVRVPVWERIDVRSGSAESKAQLRKYMSEADETCQAVSTGQSKKYENVRCLYYSGYNDQPGQEDVQHDSCVIKQGSGKNIFDQFGGDNICHI